MELPPSGVSNNPAFAPLGGADAGAHAGPMGRPKKAAHASRANGAMASNKGKAVDVKKELFGGFDDEGRYVISVVDVRRTMAKGEVRVREVGCEHDVFTYCLYHGDFEHINGGDDSDGKGKRRMYNGTVDADRWDAAAKQARIMLKECADAAPKAKITKLRKLTKGAKAPIKFKP